MFWFFLIFWLIIFIFLSGFSIGIWKVPTKLLVKISLFYVFLAYLTYLKKNCSIFSSKHLFTKKFPYHQMTWHWIIFFAPEKQDTQCHAYIFFINRILRFWVKIWLKRRKMTYFLAYLEIYSDKSHISGALRNTKYFFYCSLMNFTIGKLGLTCADLCRLAQEFFKNDHSAPKIYNRLNWSNKYTFYGWVWQ